MKLTLLLSLHFTNSFLHLIQLLSTLHIRLVSSQKLLKFLEFYNLVEVETTITNGPAELTTSKIELHRQPYNYIRQSKRHEIHVSSDAFERVFSAVDYIRTIHDENHISLDLLFEKARVAPIKRVTITNLEPQAPTLGSNQCTSKMKLTRA